MFLRNYSLYTFTLRFRLVEFWEVTKKPPKWHSIAARPYSEPLSRDRHPEWRVKCAECGMGLRYEWLGSISVGTRTGSACRGDTRTTLIFRASRAPSVGNLLAYLGRLSGFIYLPQPLTYYLLFHNFNSYCHAALLIVSRGNILGDLDFLFFFSF